MKRPRLRAPAVLAAAAVGATVILLLLAEQVAQQQLAESISDPAALSAATARLRSQFVVLSIITAPIAWSFGWLLGRFLMRPFEHVRATIAGRTRGASQSAGPESAFLEEARVLAAAAQRRDAELRGHSEQVERNAAELAQLVNSVSEGLLHLDGNGRVIHANPAALRLLTLPSDVTSQSIVALIRNVDLRQMLGRALGGESLNAAEVTVDERRLLINAQPIPDETGGRTTTVLSISDLTELRRLEGVRRDFVANVSHELKTPLTSIHGYAETLLTDEDMPADMRRKFLEIIDRNAVRLQNIVDDLLDLSRVESGVWHPDVDDVDVAAVINDAWGAFTDRASASGVTFEGQREKIGQATEDIEGATETIWARADHAALRQVIANLFDNAIRYSPAGGRIRASVREVTAANGTSVVIEISDTGTGIPRDALPRIFERFYRVDPARSRAAGGTGLGLSIVKHLMENMGGEVSAESELGKGTTMRLTLPAA